MKMLIWFFTFFTHTIWWRNGVFSSLSLHEPAGCARRFYKNWHNSKQKAFTKYQKKWSEESKEGTPMNRRGGIEKEGSWEGYTFLHVFLNSLFLLGIENWNLFERKLPSSCCNSSDLVLWGLSLESFGHCLSVSFAPRSNEPRSTVRVIRAICHTQVGLFCSNLHRWSPKHSENDDVWIVDVYGYDVSRTFIGNLWKAKGNYMKIPAATVQHKECEWFHVLPTQNW